MKPTKDQAIHITLALIIVILLSVFLIKKGGAPTPDLNRNHFEEVTEIEYEILPASAMKKKTTPAPQVTAKITKEPTIPATKTGSCKPSISGKKDAAYNAILINWTACESDDFQFYKVVKSSLKTNPSYPADPIIVSTSNRHTTNFIDKVVANRTTYYYRACVVERLSKVTCGNTIAVSY